MDQPTQTPGPTPLRVAVSGSTGLIGTELVRRLRTAGHTVARLVRSRPAAGAGDVYWSPREGEVDRAALEGVDAVVHLAGENVGERWTDERKARIRDSRVDGTRMLAEALAGLQKRPRVLVSASAVGFYGSRGDEVLDEESAPGNDFLAEVVQGWEAAAAPAASAGIRVVHPRLGVVLSREGGALKKMLTPFRLGAGGRMGSGEQWMSWVSLDDAVRALLFLMGDDRASGPVNVVSPHPVTNAQFTETLARVLGRPAFLHVPEVALKLAFGEMAEGTILASQRAVPRKLEALGGFRFRHPDLEGALRAVLERAA